MHDDGKPRTPPPHDASDGDTDADDVPALALGALDGDDIEAALRQIVDVTNGRESLATLEELVGSLGLAASPRAPRADLRERVLAATFPGSRIPLARHRTARAPAAWLSAAAALVVIAVLGVISVSQWTTAGDRADTISWLEATAESQDQRISELQSIARSAGVWVNFEQPLIWTPLEIASNQQDASGFLCRTPDGDTAYLVILGMPLERDQVFQAWLIDDDPVPAGTFRPDDDGRAFLILPRQVSPVHAFELIGVTIEPRGGSSRPSGEPVLSAEIT